jgi:hypothetical protein
VPLSRLYELTRENWKGMLEERWLAMESMEALICKRDEAIAGQARMLEERWLAMESMEALIWEREGTIIEQRKLLEKLPTLTDAMGTLRSSIKASFHYRILQLLGKHR